MRSAVAIDKPVVLLWHSIKQPQNECQERIKIMNIEEIVKAWKSDEDALGNEMPTNPVGEELSEEDLQEVTGGLKCLPIVSCFIYLTQ